MSNYINTRVLKIKELCEKLEKINQDIQTQISYLEEAKKEFKHNGELSFDIVSSTDNFSIDEKNFSVNHLYLLFKIKDQQFKIAINQDYTDLFNKKISLEVLFKLSNILSFIEQKTSLLKLSQNILNADQIYAFIYKYNEEIKTKKSDFNVNSDFLISHFNSYYKRLNTAKLSNFELYIRFKKKLSNKYITFTQGTEKKHDFIIYLPNYLQFVKDNSFLILNYNDPDLKYYSNDAIEKAYIKELFLLNKELFDMLLIKEEQINFLTIEQDQIYTNFNRFSLSEKQTNLISEKIKLNLQLTDL